MIHILSKPGSVCFRTSALVKDGAILNSMHMDTKKCHSWLFRGAILVLASSTLLQAVHRFVYDSIKLSLPDYLRVGFDCAHYALWVLLPVTGWVGESWLGRYRAIVVGLIICTITLLLFQVAFIMLNIEWTPIPAFVLAIGSLAFGTCGIGGFYTNMLPFTLDQMIGASAEELNAAVQWYLWGFFVGDFSSNLTKCILLSLYTLPVYFQ